MKSKKIIKLLLMPIIFMPVWWLVGLNFIIFHLFTAIAFLLVLVGKRGRLQWTISHSFLLMFIATYLLSLAINSHQFDVFRVVGSVYNLTYWIMGLMLMIVIQNLSVSKKDLLYLAKTMRNFGVIIGILSITTLGFAYIFDYSAIKFNTLLGNIIPFKTESLLLEHMFVATLLDVDWLFGKATPRVSGFFTYPTAMAISVATIMLLSSIYYRFCHVSKIRAALEYGLMLVALLFSTSRTVFIGIVLSVLIVTTINISRVKRLAYWEIVKRTFLLLSLCLVFYLYFLDFMTFVLLSREGSTSFRFSLYLDTIKIAMDNPVIGIGVKLTDERYYAPIGSHSTYIGALLKTGIIGLLFLLLFKISIFLKWLRTKKNIKGKLYEMTWIILGISYVTYSLWMITDDIDAPIIATFIYFLICGAILKLDQALKSKKTYRLRK